MAFVFLKPEIVIASGSLIVAGCSLLLVFTQVRLLMRQHRVDAHLRLLETNRTIIGMGFSNPELFKVLSGERIDSEMEKRYLQLWLNQMDILWKTERLGLFDDEDKLAHRQDIMHFFALPSMRSHWESAKDYYPANFQNYIDAIAEEAVQISAAGDSLGSYAPASSPIIKNKTINIP